VRRNKIEQKTRTIVKQTTIMNRDDRDLKSDLRLINAHTDLKRTKSVKQVRVSVNFGDLKKKKKGR